MAEELEQVKLDQQAKLPVVRFRSDSMCFFFCFSPTCNSNVGCLFFFCFPRKTNILFIYIYTYVYIYIYAQWPPQALHFGINLLRISTDSKNNNHQHH